MTERLYETRAIGDGKFEARVVRATARDGKTAVVLDRTLFYPTGGGQPCDLGKISGNRVVDVLEEGEDVVHLVEGDVSGDVRGEVDVARRRDHMEQHSGQHLLSAILLRKHRIPTLSFHLGGEVSTIDVGADDPSRALAAAEREANDAIRACVPVSARVFSGAAATDEAKKLRKAPEPEALASARGLRVVSIGEGAAEVDRDACCGTHVASTGELGALVVLGFERGKKGSSRVHFVVGGRAIRAVRERLDALDSAASPLSTGWKDVPARVAKLLDDAKSRYKELVAARERAVALEAQALARAEPGPIYSRLLEGGDAGGARAFATALVEARPDALVAVAHAGEKATLIVARGPQARAVDAGAVLKAALAKANGKGGGSSTFAQGAAPDGKSAASLLEAARASLTSSG